MPAERVVDGLLVRVREVACFCGQCEEPVQDVVMVAEPGEDRWMPAGTVDALGWPDADVDVDEREVIVDLSRRLIALFGAPWDDLSDQAVMLQAREAIGLHRDPDVLDVVLLLPLGELRALGEQATHGVAYRALAAHQAATS